MSQEEKLDSLLQYLQPRLPQYTLRRSRRIYGACLIVRKSSFFGADIYLQNGGAVVEASIPDTWARIVLGAGAIFLKGRPDYEEAATVLTRELTQMGYVVMPRA